MKLFWEYIRSHRRILLLQIIFFIVFTVVFALYNIPVKAVLYGLAICTFIGIIYVGIDFSAFRKKHILMKNSVEEITFTTENLPSADDLYEQDMQELIVKILEDKKRLENEMNIKYSDMNEYYTLWAHQIKTPIVAMHLMLHDDDTDKGRRLSEDLQRIEQYVEMVLGYLRLDSESNDFLFKKYDLDSIVKQAVKKFSTQFIGRKIKLIYEMPEFEVLTDEKWLLFVIEQVISNALKYTPNGSIEIYTESPKTLCIKDSGIGIAPEDLPRIFEKGYTGCNGRTDKKSSGIGLYLCRRICGKLGHLITAESEVGKGTLVKISFSETNIEIE
jgi:hypothetical protein